MKTYLIEIKMIRNLPDMEHATRWANSTANFLKNLTIADNPRWSVKELPDEEEQTKTGEKNERIN